MANLASSKPTKRLSATLSALAVFSFGPQLVVQRKVLPPKRQEQAVRPIDAIRPASIGTISGTVSWKVGQLPISTPATDSSIQQVLGLHAVIADNTPAAVAQAAPFQGQKNLPNLPRFGPMTTVGGVVSVPYTISGLPQGTAIWIHAAPNVMFEGNIPVPVKCSLSSGLEIRNYNFRVSVLMLADKQVGSSTTTMLPAIGTISGTVTWKVGDIAAPRMVLLKGMSATQSMLGLAAWVRVTSGSGTPGEPSFPGQKKVGTVPMYGQVTTAGGISSVHYTITGLPQGTTIWVQSAIPSRTFESSIPGGVKCSVSSGLEVNNYNLTFKRLSIN